MDSYSTYSKSGLDVHEDTPQEGMNIFIIRIMGVGWLPLGLREKSSEEDWLRVSMVIRDSDWNKVPSQV